MTTPDTCAGERPATGSESDIELATRLAGEAGRLLVELRHELQAQGMPIWDVMDHGDAAGHRFIADELRAHRPHDAVLDEEGAEDPRRFEADRVWIIDPLDGTREYGEGRHDWAVHVALVGSRPLRRRRGRVAGARPCARPPIRRPSCRPSTASDRGS